jgi:CheY-like chemotaxis protein
MSTGARLLVVEDDPATRAAVAHNLVAHGYRVTTADDVGSALRAWDAERPDLILLDLGLPDLDGTALIRHVRREASTPILILSARANEPARSPAWRPGQTTTSPSPSALTSYGRGSVRCSAEPADQRRLPMVASCSGRSNWTSPPTG